jgi:hypothetical protein
MIGKRGGAGRHVGSERQTSSTPSEKGSGYREWIYSLLGKFVLGISNLLFLLLVFHAY